MSWFLVILFLSLTWNSTLSSEVRPESKKLPSAVIVGTVYCDTCFQESFSMTSHFISGAYVAVEYQDGNSKPGFREEVKTNEHGEFRVQLPSSISKHLKKIKGCAVKLINSSDPYCSVASSATSSSIHLKSRKQGEHIFSAGFFSFKPLQQPTLCNQKVTSVNNSKGLNPMKKSFLPPKYDLKFPPPLQNPIPTMPGLPPLPRLPELPPLPQLPPLPHLPRLPGPLFPFAPFPGKPKQSIATEEGKDPSQADFLFPPLIPNPLQPPPLIPNPLQPPPLIPNPLQPPPSPLIPNPFQPPPAPLIPNPFQPPPAPLIPNPFQPPPAPPAPLIPNPFQPPQAPPAPLLPFPPIPGFTPSPPPPPPPSFPFIPLPPLIPGRPPASPSTVKNSP